MPEAKTAPSKPDATPSTILPPAKKKKGGGPPPEPEFPDDVTEPYRHALRQWWRYKRERHEGYKPAGWAALIRQQMKFPPEQVLASVEASMASNWAGLFTHKFADAVNPAVPAWPGKKEGAGDEPSWDWRGFAAEQLGINNLLPWKAQLPRVRDMIVKAWNDLTEEERQSWLSR